MKSLIKEEEKESENLRYLNILKAILELPFQVGKNLLVDLLSGDYKNKSIINNNLDELSTFGSLEWNKEKIIQEIERLTQNGMIESATSDYNSFIKVLKLTLKGRNEIKNPTLNTRLFREKIEFKKTKISDEDKDRFRALESLLGDFNDPQKKAIISSAEKILCVAGAGSGKTTVLTKRIEFLVNYKGINPEKILAITFTRKARQEMQRRLKGLNVKGVQVDTFNSFCEAILKKNESKVYGRKMGVQSYGDKILAMNMALASLGISVEEAINNYFTLQQRKFKTANQLLNSFMNDCFSVMDYFKITEIKGYDFSKDTEEKNKHNAKMVYQITKFLENHMQIQGLRDYTDQLIDAINFLKENPDEVPKFEYILVDEYQDVNKMQINLLEILNSKNLFVVGDPRQSIFGWRGADMKYILDFEKNYSEVEVINLTKNYRSTKEIVGLMNKAIKDMNLPDLEHHKESKKTKIKLLDFDSEESEREFVINKILGSNIPRHQIFILSRTNRQLMELSHVMKQKKIPHIVKTDEIKTSIEGSIGDITLATIHAIKGLEAKKVFVIGCNEQNFPCKASDHPAVEMVKSENYDKISEEKRLFYVAISRAKDILYLTYSGKKPTYFINEEMKKIMDNNL